MKHTSTSFGKTIENNIIRSLQMGGARLKKNLELDHNNKIDFILIIGKQHIGFQFSLKPFSRDIKKTRVATLCALEVVPRFVYLSIDDQFFRQPNKQNGKDLLSGLNLLLNRYKDQALAISITSKELEVHSI